MSDDKVHGKKVGTRNFGVKEEPFAFYALATVCASEPSAGWIDGAVDWGLRILRRFEIPRE